MTPTVFAVRAELSRLLSVKDVVVPLAVVLVLPLIGSVVGSLMDDVPGSSGGYVRGLSMMPVQDIALPIWCAAIGAVRAGERRLGLASIVRLAVPHRARALLVGVFASMLVGSGAGALVGIASVLPLIHTFSTSVALAHAGRAAVVFGILSVLGFAIGELLSNELTVWAVILSWCTVGERLLASIPHLGQIVGPVLPMRNAGYFLFGNDNGASYAWGTQAAIAVPLTWSATAVVILLLRLLPSAIRERESRP